MKLRTLLNNLTQDRNHYKVVFLLLTLGILVRFVGISTIPAGINQDEASTAYDAFSILTSGHDRMGNTYPVQLEGWGNGQYALYNYLSQPFIAIFGLNTFSVRIVNCLFGVLSLFLFYFIFVKYFDKKKALIALFFLVINPWSIMASRWGFDGNLFPVILLIGVFFLLKSINKSQRYFPLSFFFFALCLYTYATSYVYIPLFLLFVLVYLYKNKYLDLKLSVISSFVFLAIALPMIINVLINFFDLNEIKVFDIITIPKLNDSRTTQVFNLFTPDFVFVFLKNTVRFGSVVFLQSESYIYNAIPIFGYSYLISLPFFLVGLLSVINKKLYKQNNVHSIFLLWLMSAFLFGCSIHVNINRVNVVFFPIFYFTIVGFFELNEWIKTEYKKLYQELFLTIYFIYFLFFAGYYFTIFNEEVKSNFSYGLGDAIQEAEKMNIGGTIHVTNNTVNMPYIYVCFYNKVDPNDFLRTAVFSPDIESGFNNVKMLGKYTFGDYHLPTDSMAIISTEEFLLDAKYPIDSKKFGNYYVVKTNKVL